MQVKHYKTCYIIQFEGKCLGDKHSTLIEQGIDENLQVILHIILATYSTKEIKEIKIVRIRLDDPKRNILDRVIEALGLEPVERETDELKK